MHSKLRIKNTRIPVDLAIDLVESDLSISKVLEEYPSLSKEIVEKVLEFKDLLKEYVKKRNKQNILKLIRKRW